MATIPGPLELRPMNDKRITSQQLVIHDGVQVAICGTEPDQPICFTVHVNDTLKDRVADFVAAHVGLPSTVSRPPSPQQLAAVNDDDEDTELEGDDE